MKIIIILAALVLLSCVTYSQTVFKFRSTATYSRTDAAGKWIQQPNGDNVLVVIDMNTHTINTYGKKEKSLSIIRSEDMGKIQNADKVLWYYTIDDDNIKCDTYLYYFDEQPKRFSLMIAYKGFQLKFDLRKE